MLPPALPGPAWGQVAAGSSLPSHSWAPPLCLAQPPTGEDADRLRTSSLVTWHCAASECSGAAGGPWARKVPRAGRGPGVWGGGTRGGGGPGRGVAALGEPRGASWDPAAPARSRRAEHRHRGLRRPQATQQPLTREDPTHQRNRRTPPFSATHRLRLHAPPQEDTGSLRSLVLVGEHSGGGLSEPGGWPVSAAALRLCPARGP